VIEFLAAWSLTAIAFTIVVPVALKQRHEAFDGGHVMSILLGSLLVTGIAQYILWMMGW